MATVADLLIKKGYEVLTVRPNLTVMRALEKMEDISIGSALVVDKGTVLGILTERDVIQKVVLQDKNADDVTVQEVMNAELIAVLPEVSLQECLELITFNHVRHLPVMREGKLCGIVSIGDLVKFMSAENAYETKHQDSFITSVL